MKKNITYFGLMMLIVALPNVLLLGRASGIIRRDPAIDPHYIRVLEKKHPSVVFVGNSLVDKGVDNTRFSRLTGVRAEKIVEGGSSSAWWYLAIKNLVLATDYRPQVVVVCFRDNRLTKPGFRTTGKHKAHIDSIAGADEPLLDDRAYMNQMDWLSRLLISYAPLYRYRQDMSARLERFVKDGLVSPVLDLEEDVCDDAIVNVFQEDRMIPEILSRMQIAEESGDPHERYDFSTELPNSFLPEMIRLAHENGIRLCFVRMKRTRDLTPGREPAGLPEYIEALKAYLAANDVPFYDFTHDPRIRLEHYGAGEHLNTDAGQRVFTEMLAEALAPQIHSLSTR